MTLRIILALLDRACCDASPCATSRLHPHRRHCLRHAALQGAFHVADELVAAVLAGEVNAQPLASTGPAVVTWPGAGKE